MNKPTNNPTIDQFCQQWRQAKQAEDQAKKTRTEIEQQMLEVLAFNKPEGSETIKTDTFKVTLTGKLNRKLDTHKWEQVKESIPPQLNPVEESISYKIIDKGIRYLEANEPDTYKLIAPCLTTTPAKTAVKVEVL